MTKDKTFVAELLESNVAILKQVQDDNGAFKRGNSTFKHDNLHYTFKKVLNKKRMLLNNRTQ